MGGIDAEENEYPWQAFVAVGRIRCAGVVIGDKWVLTTERCMVRKARPRDIKVYLGEHNIKNDNDKGMLYNVEQIIRHPKFTKVAWGLYYNDFALMKLSSKIDWAAHVHIRPICLPSDTSQSYVGRDAIVAGWGLLENPDVHEWKLNPTLKEVTVKVITNAACDEKYVKRNRLKIYPQHLCTNDDGKGSCQGDAGSPLISTSGNGVKLGENYELIGIVSFGIGCGNPNYPDVYSRITSALDWIYSATSGSWSTCPRT